MVLTNQELVHKQQKKIEELHQRLRKPISEAERQAITCALYCWENLS